MNATLPSEPAESLLADAPAVAAPTVEPFHAPLPPLLRVAHVFIIVNLLVQCLYGSYQIFWVLQPAGTFGPMFGHATEVPYELMMARRMYALESWIAFLGLALYLGVTEVLPRRWRPRAA